MNNMKKTIGIIVFTVIGVIMFLNFKCTHTIDNYTMGNKIVVEVK